MSAPCPRCGSVACAEDRAAYEAFGDPPDIFEGGALEPVADPDADRPCSCEESERLRARISDLEQRNESFVSILRIANDNTDREKARVRELEQSQERLANGLFRADQFGQEQLTRVRELEAARSELIDRALNADVRAKGFEHERHDFEGALIKEQNHSRNLERALDAALDGMANETTAKVAAESEARALREKITRACDLLSAEDRYPEEGAVSAALEALRD